MKKAFTIMLALTFLVFLIAVLNYWIAISLLHLNEFPDSLDSIPKNISPVAKPVVLCYRWSGDNSEFLRVLGLDRKSAEALPRENPLLVDISWVQKANPYPPLLSEINSDPNEPYYFSYGYIGVDSLYHQITFYGGEADTTPSFLVPKVRRGQTYYGDYFVQYTVYLSKVTIKTPLISDNHTGAVLEWAPPPEYPNIDRIDWSTYAGGSYDGFEEISFTFVGTLVAVCAITAGVVLIRIAKQKKKITSQIS